MRRWLEALAQDLGYAVRSFRRSPAFVLVALLSLTLGIGATSAIFSVIYGVLIAPYPYARPGEIWAPQARALDKNPGWACAGFFLVGSAHSATARRAGLSGAVRVLSVASLTHYFPVSLVAIAAWV